jgi:hypothetical protein
MRGIVLAALFAGIAASCPVRADELDTEHLFGLTEGSDIGAKGDKEIELDFGGAFDKGGGTYRALSQTTSGKFTIFDHFRIAPGITVDHHHIRGVPGLDDRNQLAFAGASLEMKARLLDRHRAPFGVTVGVIPNWRRVDEASGEPVDSYGLGFLFLADREIVGDRVFAAFNAIYDPAASRSRITGEWTRESTLAFSGAIAVRAAPNVFLSGDLRYARAYDSFGLDSFAGHALFAGPAIYANLSKNIWISAVWSAQIAGRAVADPGALDLTNFERHQARVRIGIHLDAH